MKFKLTTFIVVAIATASLSSCTKNIKNDLRGAQKNLDSLKKINEELRNKPGSLEQLIGSDHPLIAITTFEDKNGSVRNILDTFFFREHNSYSNRMTTNVDGSIDVRIERYSALDWAEYASIRFIYDPVTKKAEDIICYHLWEHPSNYGDEAYYRQSNGSGLTLNFNLQKFDINSGEIAVSVAATADGTYTQTNPNSSPNPGKPVSTKFSFTGKLVKYSTN